MLRQNARKRTGALVLREEHVGDLNFADPQGINHMKCKDFAAKYMAYKTSISMEPKVNSPTVIT